MTGDAIQFLDQHQTLQFRGKFPANRGVGRSDIELWSAFPDINDVPQEVEKVILTLMIYAGHARATEAIEGPAR